MSSVFTTIGSGVHIGNTISDELLGVNMRFHHNRTKEGSGFQQVMEQIDTTSIRYPGGTITEEHFDITNPNEKKQVNVMHLIHPELIPERSNGVPIVRTVTPLSDYLEFVDARGGDPIVVLPTYRFFDQHTRTLTSNAFADIATFVHNLFSDQFGAVDNVTIEIGNEYFQDRFNWTETEFSWIQSTIAQIIHEQVSNMGLRQDLTLLAQGGHVRNNNIALTDASNLELASRFAGLDPATIDGVTLHAYGTNGGSSDPLTMTPNIQQLLAGTNATWAPVLGADFEIAMTEWNVGEDGPNKSVVNGMMRTAPLLNMFAEMVRGGVDSAQIFAARVDGPAGLAMRSEDGSELTPTGHFFSMLSESTKGLRLVNQGLDYLLHNAAGNHVGYSYTFEGADRSVTYFASGKNQTIALTAEMSQQIRDGAYVYARTLHKAPGDAVNGYYSDAAVSYSTDVQLSQNADGLFYQATLKAYQLIELHVVYGQGVTMEGGRTFKKADNLVGSAYADELLGYGGADNLDGQGGNDLLDGGFGADVLNGAAGTDVMLGGVGRDRLVGGTGNDELLGGRGHDHLLGQEHNDLLFGGAGFDQLFGDNDADILFGGRGADSLFGGNGDDQLNGDGGADLLLGDNGQDILAGGTGADLLYGGADNDLLKGGKGKDLLFGDAGDDVLEGGNARDVLIGGAGNDVLSGGRGSDSFVFKPGSGIDVILDFNAAQDWFDLREFNFTSFDDLMETAEDTDSGARLNLTLEEAVLLNDVNLEALSANNFAF